jgi:glyoxylase-like metal-dependent hydrolase (beta-lactamase superfamily II)
MARVIKVENGQLQVNSYICYIKGGDCFIVDPSDDPKEIITKIEHFDLKPKFVILTHGHCDHISGVNEIVATYQIPVYAHELEKTILENESFNLSQMVYNKSIIIKNVNYLKEGITEIEGIKLETILMPGHTKGSICIYLDEDCLMFTGDVIFKNSIGRTDLPTGDQKTLMNSLKRLGNYSKRMVIYPGHGSRTTLRDEMSNNPYLKV